MNIYPLSSLVNQFRDVKISRKTRFIMWFSGELLYFISKGYGDIPRLLKILKLHLVSLDHF